MQKVPIDSLRQLSATKNIETSSVHFVTRTIANRKNESESESESEHEGGNEKLLMVIARSNLTHQLWSAGFSCWVLAI